MKPPSHRSFYRPLAALVCSLVALLVGLHFRLSDHPHNEVAISDGAATFEQERQVADSSGVVDPHVATSSNVAKSSEASVVTRDLREWLRQRIVDASASSLADGVTIASRRKVLMRELFVTAPEAALENSLSIQEYEQVPDEMKPLIEKHFSALANYTCFPVCPGPDGAGVLNRRELVPNDLKFSDGVQLKVFVVGARREIGSKRDLPVQGIALDGLAVMRDGVFYKLSNGDRAVAHKYFDQAQVDSSKSFVTGKKIEGDPILALAGGKIFSFESEPELEAFDKAVARLDVQPGPRSGSRAIFALPYQADGGAGGFNLQAAEMNASAGAADWTLTPKKVFLIRVDFPDKVGDPISKLDAEAVLNGEARGSISDMSYGRTTISGTASAVVYRMPQPSTYYADTTAAGYGGDSFKSLNDKLLSDAKARFRASRAGSGDAAINIGASDSEYGDYDVIGVTFVDIGAYNAGVKYAGLASLGAGDLWMQKSNDAKVYVHEFGHIYGLGHSNFWLTTDASVVGAGSEKEYGDVYDVMGAGELPRGHFHPQAKKKVLWIDDPQWQDASLNGDGSYSIRLHRIDSADTEQKLRGIRVTKTPPGAANPEYYWIGYRASYTDNIHLLKGAYLLWQRAGSEKCCLIDTTPATSGDKTDAALFLGRTYSDTTAKAHITTVASGGSLGTEYIDVQINLGTFSGNQSPVLTAVVGPSTGWARTNLKFSAPASDANGDTLSYFWSFSDGTLIGGTGVSAAQVTHAFVMGGNHHVSVTVSDMKGGTLTRSKSLSIEDPSQNFSQSQSGTSADIRSVASNGLLAVAVGTADSSGDRAVIRTSSDGVHWTARGVLESTLNLKLESVYWSGERFVAVGQDLDASKWHGVIYTSENGLSWTRRYFDDEPGRPLACVTSGKGVYIAGGEGGALLFSRDGFVWESVSLLPLTHKAAGVAFGNGTFVLTAHLYGSQAGSYSGGAKVFTSENGLDWQDHTAGAGIDATWQDLRTIAFLNDRFIASGWYSKLRFSIDGGKTFSTTRTFNETAEVLTYYNGLYFAVGTERVGSGSSSSTSEVALYSVDGANWSRSASFVTSAAGCAVFNGRILTVSDGGDISQSDPLDPVPLSSPPVISNLEVPTARIARRSLVFGVQASDPDNDRLQYSWDAGDGFGVGAGAQFSYSWLVGGSYDVSVTASDGKGGSKTQTRTVWISDPLMPFSARGTPIGTLNAIAASDSLAVAVGDKGKIQTSVDGVTWVDRSLNPIPQNLNFESVSWEGSKFIAVGRDYDFNPSVKGWVGVVYTSSDGISWSRVYASAKAGTTLRKVGFGDGFSFAVGDMGTVIRSSNNIDWSAVQLVAGSYDVGGIAYGKGKFVMMAHRQGINSGYGKVFVSADGSSWEDRSATLSFDDQSWQDLRKVAFVNDRFIASGWYSKIRFSIDAALNFSPVRAEPENIESVVYGNGLYVGVGNNQRTNVDLLFVSEDGVRWESLKPPSGWEKARSVAFFKDSILLAGGSGLIAQSSAYESQGRSPSLIIQPVGTTVNPGQTLTLSAKAAGSSTIFYQWKKNGINVNGGTGSTYVIATATEADEGTYAVVVSNYVGAITSSTVEVRINDPTEIVTQPVDTNIGLGGTISLSVTATGTGPLSYQWKKDGVNIEAANQPFLKIMPVLLFDSGSYQVEVTGATGSVLSNIAAVTVLTGALSQETLPKIESIVGADLRWELPSNGNAISYYVKNLPPGLQFNNGTLTGAAHDVGAWEVQITVFDGVSIVRSALLPIQVAPLNASVCGLFSGIVEQNDGLNDNLFSRVDCVVRASGAVSGRLIGSKGSVTFMGGLKTTPAHPLKSSMSLPLSASRAGQNLQLELMFDGSSQRLSGQLFQKSSGISPQNLQTANISGWRSSWSKFQVSDQAGNYQFYISADHTQVEVPQGYGFGRAFVSRESGVVSVWGSLGDSQRISSACPLGPLGEILIYSLLYGGSGSCVGVVSVEKGANVPVENTIGGPLTWTKNGWATRGPRVSPQNFEATIQLNGRYQSSGTSRLGNLTSAGSPVEAQLGIGASQWINLPLSLVSSVGSRIEVRPSSDSTLGSYDLKMQSIDKRAEMFSGGIKLPGSIRRANFWGQIMNEAQDWKGYGFFLAPRAPEAGAPTDTSIFYSGKVILETR